VKVVLTFNTSSLTFREIKQTLIEKNIFVESEIEDSEIFEGINSILNANSSEITFLNNNNQNKGIAKSLAKACIVNKKSKNLLPNNCKPIFVDDTYKSFALISNLFNLKRVSNGKISELSFVDKNSQIGNNVEIRSFSHIENAIIESNVIIGPFARIRPGSHLLTGSRVGNFVEIKKSKIGKNSKVPHLSYVGDTTIGKNVNIGAGTITCNYDGKKKNRTKISDEVFIGSNTSLVAPIKIGKKAMIGAGSTITKNVKNKSLALTRANQIEIKNYKKK